VLWAELIPGCVLLWGGGALELIRVWSESSLCVVEGSDHQAEDIHTAALVAW